MNGSSDDSDIVASTATAEHIRKFVFSCNVGGGGDTTVDRLEIRIPEVNKKD